MSKLMKLLISILMVGLVCGPALAKPRVAMLELLEGSATLAGKQLKAPKLAREGQVLKVSPASKVRVQMLGTNREYTIQGAKTLTISKADMEKQAVALSRGGIAVAGGIGNVTKGAVGMTRAGETAPTGVKLQLPPKNEDGSWRIEITVEPEQFAEHGVDSGALILGWETESGGWDEGEAIDFEDLPKRFAKLWSEGGSASFTLSEDSFEAGHNYRMIIQLGDGDVWYERPFRILTPEESELLSVMDQDLHQQSSASKSVVPLLKLAGLYRGLGQLSEANGVLDEAYRSPFRPADDQALEESILKAWLPIRKALDLGPVS